MKHLLIATVVMIAAARLQAAEPQLAHMVFFTLAEDSKQNRETLVAACQKYLSDHDGTVYFSAGSINEELNREVNDRDFDVALHLVFASRKHHDTYQTHPQHLKFIAENKHLWSTVRVFDSNVATSSHDSIPVGGTGFAGLLRGEVVSKPYGQIILEVTEVGQVWRHSKAKNAKSLVGKRVVLAGPDQGANISKFISLLRVGETVTVDVANKESDSLTILELTEDQRKRVKKSIEK